MIHEPLDPETSTLLNYLNSQREHAVGILKGLDEEDLRRSVLPSGWTPLGLIQHLAVDVERFWFGAVVAGDQEVIDELAGASNAWEPGAEISVEAIFDQYQREIKRANAIIGGTSMDAPPAWWPSDLFGDYRLHTVREIVLHVITETACHAGHLDAARELIDGRLWLALPD